MPDRDVHRRISKIIVDDSCERVHYLMDYPCRFLGNKHRILFHDPISAMIIGYFAKGDKGAVSALAHIITDYSVTELRKYLK